ncbi:PAS domain-containing protein [Rhodopseudomonas boonkerdii]|uniref:PAS domain-containing protein n=1 Tax=Rhodopseudomonas boonkerdii TaxID=475937 RepID=UPI001E393C3B|nr:PAS domain-containing protein [Rhodopseudomonas boonkerdii]UGV27301.1 PAS domain-containing protein [Rhodopseudomonas boonkerdii]
MKHPSNRKFFAYWDEKRGYARAPDRSEIEPGPMRELLGDIFVLGYDKAADFPFRVAGTRVCALLGRDLKNKPFPELFTLAGRGEIEEIITVVSEELLVAVAGIAAHTEFGDKAHLELLLLPFAARAHTPISLTGLLAPMTPFNGRLGPMQVTSYRYLAHQPQRFVPRVMRKLQAARGLMVYEGVS